MEPIEPQFDGIKNASKRCGLEYETRFADHRVGYGSAGPRGNDPTGDEPIPQRSHQASLSPPGAE